jgi:diguanylate cyclase (GGDEF)-like protein
LDERLLFAVQVLFYASFPIAFASLRSAMRLTFLYVYIGMVVVVGGLLGAMYAFPLTEDVVISAGTVAYGALMLSSVLLVIVGNDLQVVRNVVKVVLTVNVFTFVLFSLSEESLRSAEVLNPLGTPPEVFSSSIRVVVLGGVLIVIELLLLITLFERVKVNVSGPGPLAVSYVLAFVGVLCLDGVLFPLVTAAPTEGLGRLIARGTAAKLVLAAAFSIPLIGFLTLFRTTVARYGSAPIAMGTLFRFRTDLVREIERQQTVLDHQASHDGLTGLANRSQLVDRIEHALAGRSHVAPGQPDLAVLFLDLDDFKTVNDGHGHRVGDAVLRAIGERIVGCLRKGDTAARIGGDEFAVLLEDVVSPSVTQDVGARMLEHIGQPLIIGAATVTVRASMGIAFARRGRDVAADDLIHNADLAMYRSKAGGKSRFTIYEPSMHQAVIERATLITDIRDGLDRHEFVMHYQPIVEIATGHVLAVEALLRWQHPKHGLLPPAAFIGLAEESDLIVSLGAQALVEACRDVKAWHDRWTASVPADVTSADGPSTSGAVVRMPIAVTVNLSTRQFQEPSLIDEVVSALRTSGLPADLLTLEITESNFMTDVADAIETLRRLKALGVHISIDDFGTGFSSLSYLQRLPVDALKIDKSFIDRIGAGTESDIALTRSIIGLGASLDLVVIAEGIEAEEQRDVLVDLRCPLGQGYHFGRPMSSDEAERRLRPASIV